MAVLSPLPSFRSILSASKTAFSMTKTQHMGTEGNLSLHLASSASDDDFFFSLSVDKWTEHEYESVL